jgi:hypothetical protein
MGLGLMVEGRASRPRGAPYLGSHKWVFGLKGGRSEASVRMRMPLRSGIAVRLQGSHESMHGEVPKRGRSAVPFERV